MKVLANLSPNDTKGPPPAGLAGDALLKWKYQRYMQDYLACVQSVDDNVSQGWRHPAQSEKMIRQQSYHSPVIFMANRRAAHSPLLVPPAGMLD